MFAQGTMVDYMTGVPGLQKKILDSQKRPPPTTVITSPSNLPPVEELVDIAVIPLEARKVLPQFHLDASFPPTHLLHGTKDQTVLLSESVRTYEQLKAVGVDAELYTVEGGEHNFEIGNEDKEDVKTALESCLNFLVKHLS